MQRSDLKKMLKSQTCNHCVFKSSHSMKGLGWWCKYLLKKPKNLTCSKFSPANESYSTDIIYGSYKPVYRAGKQNDK